MCSVCHQKVSILWGTFVVTVKSCWPKFDETSDLFNEMSKAKEQLLEDLFKEIRPDVDKINENTNKLIPEIYAVKDNTDTRAKQILEQNNETKENILAQGFTNTESIMTKLESLEQKLNELSLNQRTSGTCE